MMKAEIKKQWVAALRSGKFKQGYGALHQAGNAGAADAFCCMGVLCALSPVPGRVSDVVPTVLYNGNRDTLPPAVFEWAGLPAADPYVRLGGDSIKLSRANDSLRLTFDEIADLIDEQL